MSSHYDTAVALLDDAENAGGTQTEIQQSQVHALLAIGHAVLDVSIVLSQLMEHVAKPGSDA